jgi:hypothetical protein
VTRQECEQKILDKLDEIRGLLNEYDQNLEYCVVGFGANSSYVYKLAMDCNGEPITGDYLMNATRFTEEGLTNAKCMAG